MKNTERLSIAQYRQIGKKPKYRNVKTVVDGIRFDSKLEAARYEELKQLQQRSAVRWFIRQVPFDLPGGIKYRADFVVVWDPAFYEPAVTVEDCKGYMTATSKLKITQVEAIYGITVQLIRRA